jgi:hypothetical protein
MPSSAEGYSQSQAAPATGTTQQRHAARVDQQYALAQYTAQQQYFQTQQAAYPHGDLPPIRDIARETRPSATLYSAEQPPPSVQASMAAPAPVAPAAPAAPPASSDALVAKARDLVELHATGVLTNAELMKSLVSLFRAP